VPEEEEAEFVTPGVAPRVLLAQRPEVPARQAEQERASVEEAELPQQL
jgi:hypothetical protein